MARFLRFVLLLFLALVGFGTGICGTLGVVMLAADPSSRHEYGAVVVVIVLVLLAIAAACFFAVRALARRMNRSAAAPSTPDVSGAGSPIPDAAPGDAPTASASGPQGAPEPPTAPPGAPPIS